MHIKRIHSMIEKLTECAESNLARGTDCVETEEMKSVADIIKNMCEAEYYAKISKAMDEDLRYYDEYRYENGRFAPKGRGRRMYEEPYYRMTPNDYRFWDENRDMDRHQGRMYYTEPMGNYENHRRTYMETKTNGTKENKIKALEEYAKSLTEDVTDMIADATVEEKNLIRQKIAMLAQKI